MLSRSPLYKHTMDLPTPIYERMPIVLVENRAYNIAVKESDTESFTEKPPPITPANLLVFLALKSPRKKCSPQPFSKRGRRFTASQDGHKYWDSTLHVNLHPLPNLIFLNQFQFQPKFWNPWPSSKIFPEPITWVEWNESPAHSRSNCEDYSFLRLHRFK